MKAESILLQVLFDRLNESGVCYAVLRNYETLPYSLGGSDLDLLVSSESLNEVYELVKMIARIHGGHCISCISDFRVTVINCRFCGKGNNTSLWWGLPIDLFATVGLRQYEFFETKSVLSNSLMYRDICVASPRDAAIIAFLKECLANGKGRKNYEKETSMAYVSDELRYKKILEEYFGIRVARLWGRYLTFGGDARTLRQISRRARWTLRVRAWFRNPFRSLRNTCTCIWRRWARVFQPPGFAVAVTGTDGSGKSTIIHGIEPIMEAALHKKPKYEHLRPNLLPSIARLFGRPGTSSPVMDPHASKPSGFLGSFARLLYYSLDYIFGYWFKVYPALVKRQNLYVFDRYYYDYLIDPQRSRIRLPHWIIKTVGILIPRPDLILCLGADPKVIHARKPELPLEEVERQVADLRQFCQKNRRAVWIDTGCSVEDSVDKSLNAITSCMAARYEKVASHDERGISWKVLLPVAEESRVLAVGLIPEEVAGLSRSYRRIDMLPSEQKYDIVVIGKEMAGAVPIDRCLSCLADSGTLAVVGSGYARCKARRSGLTCAGEYAALPPDKPRLFIPLASRTLRDKALTFHRPGSFRARVGLLAAKGLSLIGIRRHLMKHTISIYARDESVLNKQNLLEWLSKKLGYTIDDLVIFAGSESPRRKITALAVDSRQGRDVVIKIADTELGTEAIKQESQTLRELEGSPLSSQVPKLIWEGQWNSYYLQLQEKAIGVDCKQTASLTDAHFDFLSKLSAIDRKILPLKETQTWLNINDLAKSSSSKVIPKSIGFLLEKILSDEFANIPVVCHRVHGDFAPWNIKVNNGKLFVYDWENSLSDGLALTDVFHFIYRQASLLGPWPIANKIIFSMVNFTQSLAAFAELREPFSKESIENFLAVWIVKTYLDEPCEKLAELASVLETQPQ